MSFVPPEGFPTTTQLVEQVPLIKSPSFWVQKPVELPPDIHPLPEDVKAYFVYTHALESHALQTLPSRLHQLQQSRSSHLAYLKSREEDKERKRLEALRKVAPGYLEGGMMEPMRAAVVKNAGDGTGMDQEGGVVDEGKKVEAEDPLKALVDGLEALDAKRSSPSAGTILATPVPPPPAGGATLMDD